MTNRITARAAVLVLAVATIITACGTAPTPHRPQVAPIIIVVGSASTAESEIVAAIYAGALNIRGIRATTQLNFSSRRAYVDALTQGTIALVPEDPSALFAYLKPGASPPTNLLAALRSVLPPSLDVLQPSPATPPAIPLIRKDKETAEIARILDEVSAKLTTRAMARLNADYHSPGKPSPATIAAKWLSANNL